MKKIILLIIAIVVTFGATNAQVTAKLGGTIVAEALGDGYFAPGFTAGVGVNDFRAEVIYAQRSQGFYDMNIAVGAPKFDAGSRRTFGLIAGYAVNVNEEFRVVPKFGFVSTKESFETDNYVSRSPKGAARLENSYGGTVMIGVDLEANLNSNTAIVFSTGWPQVTGVAVQVRF